MKITLVRHAEVIEEYQGKYNGHIDIPLSDKGKKDAIVLAQELSHIKFDKVYCSDLIRAKETLQVFKLNTIPIYTRQLREKSWGEHEGKSFLEIESSGIKYENFTQWIEALDGENIDDYIQNIKLFFYKTLKKEQAKNMLVITHSGVIKVLLHLTQNISLEEAFSKNIPYSSSLILEI